MSTMSGVELSNIEIAAARPASSSTMVPSISFHETGGSGWVGIGRKNEISVPCPGWLVMVSAGWDQVHAGGGGVFDEVTTVQNGGFSIRRFGQ
jgi:hypothetical protein